MNIYYIYICAGSLACFVAVILFLSDKKSYSFFYRSYWRFLWQPWKIVTFLIAASGMTLLAPYTNDPTWDYFDAMAMSVMTFLTAPWVVGILYKTIRKGISLRQAFVAVCVWLFTASWFYDIYLLLRDGHYPLTWWPNMWLSSVLYLSAGLLWNLEYQERRGVTFSFMSDNWPTVSSRFVFYKIIWFVLPFMLIASLMILAFVFSR